MTAEIGGGLGVEIGAATVRPVSLFYSYSHCDEEFRRALETHLSVLKRSRLIAAWHDGMIGAGGDWRGEIDRNLASADIVLLLVSSDFIASDYCWHEEMAKALQRHERGEARVIPVILRPCQWRETPLAELQAVPKGGKPVTEWPNRDTAFVDVAAAIKRIIKDQQQKRLRAAKEANREAEEERLRAEAKAAREAEEQRRHAEAAFNLSKAPPNADALCEITESSFYYSDQHVWVKAFLPRTEQYFGSCAIWIKQESLEDCIITVEHRKILSTLFHGHRRGVNAQERRIIAYGPSEHFEHYAIDIGGTRLFLSDRVVHSLCSAIDALHEAYLEALKKIDLAWEADGFSYEDRGSSEVGVCLGRLPAWLWSRIVEFAREHDYERGDSEWHMFDANEMSLVLHSPAPTRRFDEGIHAYVLASGQSPAGTLTTGTIALLWNPPPRFRGDIYPLSERRYWGAATTFRWINEELIPKTYEWIWSNEPRAIRWSPRARQHKARLFSRLKDHGGLVNYGRQDVRHIDFHPDLAGFRGLVATLQQEFHGRSGEEYIIEKQAISGLYRAIILSLQHVEASYLGYVASNLGASGVRDENKLIEILEERIEKNNLPSDSFSVDCALRSLLDLLSAHKVYLNQHEIQQITSHLSR